MKWNSGSEAQAEFQLNESKSLHEFSFHCINSSLFLRSQVNFKRKQSGVNAASNVITQIKLACILLRLLPETINKFKERIAEWSEAPTQRNKAMKRRLHAMKKLFHEIKLNEMIAEWRHARASELIDEWKLMNGAGREARKRMRSASNGL